MNLRKCFAVKNNCYKAGKKMIPLGIMVHSTGANNPKLSRYVQPDDGLLGVNPYNNHFNTAKPGGRSVCVHAFIGKLKDGSIATYQIMPWNMQAWHSGGSANKNYIGFEICEDGLKDAEYFGKVYTEAVELCAYLCREYGLSEKNILCHSEGYKKGIASNHGDVLHWFPKFGKSMDSFRADVKAALGRGQTAAGSSEAVKAEHVPLPYVVRITADSLNVRAGAGVHFTIKTSVKRGEAFTITAEKNGWGKLKSGAGWIKLSYTEKV